MTKIYLNNTKTFNHNCKGDYHYGMFPLRMISNVADYKDKHENSVGEVQRKADQKHIAEIAKSLKAEKKLYLWTMLISVTGPMSIHSDVKGDYIEWPETKNELAEFAQYISINDGQHRALAPMREPTLWDIIGENYPVMVNILDNPSTTEMTARFVEVNGRNKAMNKNLLFDMMAQTGELNAKNPDAYIMLNILKRANEDPRFPLYRKIKFGEGQGKYNANTIVNNCVNEVNNLVESMRKLNYTENEMYDLFIRYWKGIEDQNVSDSTGGSDRHTNKFTATRIAYMTSMMAPTINILKDSGKYLTEKNMGQVYAKWVHDVLGCENSIMESDNRAMNYRDTQEREFVVSVSNRWNGRAAVRQAMQTDHDLLERAYKGTLICDAIHATATDCVRI